MMTPNDVAQHRFTTARFGGYATNDVDDFLDQLTLDYTALYKENAVLKGKMKVLVDKIAEYRATEDDMRMALLTARKAADSILAEAEEKREQMLLDAENEAGARRLELRRDMENSEAQVKAARQSVLDFAAGLNGLIAQQQALLDEKTKGMQELFAQQQAFLNKETSFLNRLSEIEADEEPEAPAAEPVEEAEPTMKMAVEEDQLAAEMAAAAAAAEAAPEAALRQFDETRVNSILEDEVDEPTRIVDLSSANQQQDYSL